MIVCKSRSGGAYAIAGCYGKLWTVWREHHQAEQLTTAQLDERYACKSGHVTGLGFAKPEVPAAPPVPPPPTRRWQDVTAEEVAKVLDGESGDYLANVIRARATRLAEQDAPETADQAPRGTGLDTPE